MRLKPIMYMYFLIVAVLLIGCSSETNPVTPNNSGTIADDISTEKYLSSGLLGVFAGHIDVGKLEGELAPFRNTSSQDVLEVVDITNFLSMAPCYDCVKLHSIELNADSNIVASIGIRHPFEAGDPLKPITGRNRADLHVFNIEGIIAIQSGDADSFTGFGTSVASGGLLNASGYTGYLDDALDEVFPTDANLHPYILHYRDYSNGNYDPANENGFADVFNPSGYLIMPMGGDEDIREYIFDFSNAESVDFILAIGCTYGISADNKSMRMSPIFRLPQFNKKAASEVSVEITSNNLAPGNPTSDATLTVNILDMNHGVAVGENLGEMRAASDISAISVEVSGVTASPVVDSNPTSTGGDPRDPLNPLAYEITFTNNASAAMGTYRGLVKVTDSYMAGLNESTLLNGADGINRVDPLVSPLEGTFNIPEFATYQAFTIDVGGGNLPPVADLDVSSETVESGCTIDLFPGPGTHDPDGSIALYEYDFDYDGTTFDVDASNTNGDPVTAQMMNPNITDITIDVAMRVTDDGAPALTDIDTVTITVVAYWLDINFLNSPTEIWMRPFDNTGTLLDPAICIEDDDQVCVAAVSQNYNSADNDGPVSVHSDDGGINWGWPSDGHSTTYTLAPPVKLATDIGDPTYPDSYFYFSRLNLTDANNYIRQGCGVYCVHDDAPFDHCNEIYGSAASGYIYAFGDDNDQIKRHRSSEPHEIGWFGSLDTLNIVVTDSDPRLSWVRSIGEDSSGLMFLAYYNSNENIIKRIKSDDILGDAWTEGTIWDGSSGGYSGMKDPGVDIDDDDNIHVSFLRHDDISGENQICYVMSNDGGTTFSEPDIAVSSTGIVLNPPIIATTIGCHDVVYIAYEEDGDIYLTITWSGGTQFESGIVVSTRAEMELNPDYVMDDNDDLIFAWQVDDSIYHGSTYTCKVEIIEN